MKGKGLCETFWYLGTSTTPLRLCHQLPLVSIAAAQEMLEFDFDVTTVPTDDASIVQATFQIFVGLLDLNQINVSPTTLKCFIRNLGFRYNNPHYHNFHHAFQVCQFTAALYHKCFLQKAREGGGETGTQFLRAIFASLISAISHDVGHDGFTNAFHVKTKSKLAHTFYNNSPMENHHIFTTMHVLGTNGCNVFENWSSDFQEFSRYLICNTILATDMKNHGEVLRELRADDGASINPHLMTEVEIFADPALRPSSPPSPASSIEDTPETPEDLSSKIRKVIRTISRLSMDSLSGTESTSCGPVDPLYDVLKLSRVIVHSADIANCVRPFQLCHRYAQQLRQEFSVQVSRERQLRLPVLASMDNKSDEDFFLNEAHWGRYMARDYFRSLAEAFPCTQVLVSSLQANVSKWEELSVAAATQKKTEDSL